MCRLAPTRSQLCASTCPQHGPPPPEPWRPRQSYSSIPGSWPGWSPGSPALLTEMLTCGGLHDASTGRGHRNRAGIIEDDEQVTFRPLPGDRHPFAGHPLPDLPPHRRIPARPPQRGPDRALPPGPSGSARPRIPVTDCGDPRYPRGYRRRPRSALGRPCRAPDWRTSAGDGAWSASSDGPHVEPMRG
jgi:hypothetical protein